MCLGFWASPRLSRCTRFLTAFVHLHGIGIHARQQVDELREALGKVEVNMVTNLVDPYCVAMGTKTKVVRERQSVR